MNGGEPVVKVEIPKIQYTVRIPLELTEPPEDGAYEEREESFMASGIPAVVREISSLDMAELTKEEGFNRINQRADLALEDDGIQSLPEHLRRNPSACFSELNSSDDDEEEELYEESEEEEPQPCGHSSFRQESAERSAAPPFGNPQVRDPDPDLTRTHYPVASSGNAHL